GSARVNIQRHPNRPRNQEANICNCRTDFQTVGACVEKLGRNDRPRYVAAVRDNRRLFLVPVVKCFEQESTIAVVEATVHMQTCGRTEDVVLDIDLERATSNY